VAVEDEPADLYLGFVGADVAAVAVQEPVAALVADPKADVVTGYGRRRSDGENRPMAMSSRSPVGPEPVTESLWVEPA